MDDPIRTMVFQPLVDRVGISPKAAARTMADVFMATAVTLTSVRSVTVDWETPGLAATLAMAIVGAAILWGLMRFCAAVGPAFVTGPFAAVHLLMRMVLVYSVAADVVQTWTLVSNEAPVVPISLMRALMQLAQNVSGAASLYLALCTDPPPRRPRSTPIRAGA